MMSVDTYAVNKSFVRSVTREVRIDWLWFKTLEHVLVYNSRAF
jgi:hypothetical protein